MELKGEPGKALFIGSFSSLVGGLVSGVALILTSVPLSDFGSIVFVCSDYTKYPRPYPKDSFVVPDRIMRYNPEK